MTVKKGISKIGPENNNGKSGPAAAPGATKTTVKYTFERTKEDIENLKKLRRVLQSELNMGFYNNFNTDSAIYRKLPILYMDTVKKREDQDQAIQELTAKLDDMQQLRDHFCRILEICNQSKNNPKKPEVKTCYYFKSNINKCYDGKKCNGKNTKCKEYYES